MGMAPARRNVRGAAEAARVEDLRLGVVEAPEVVRPAAAVVAEDLRSLEEERTLLLEERFERRQVDHRRVDFDLSEIRVDRRRRGEIAGDADLRVESGGGKRARAVVERVAGSRRDEFAAGRG